MLEVIGALALTIVALIFVTWFVGMPMMGLAFGGPSVGNWAWVIGGLVCASLVVLGWWHFVGTKIHFGFG